MYVSWIRWPDQSLNGFHSYLTPNQERKQFQLISLKHGTY